MPAYRRPRVPGATLSFTVALADRGSSLLLDRVDLLREAVRVTKGERPFEVVAWVVLPGHMHCVWRLPEGVRRARKTVRWTVFSAERAEPGAVLRALGGDQGPVQHRAAAAGLDP